MLISQQQHYDIVGTKVSKEDLVVYSLSRILDPENGRSDLSREDLMDVLDISRKTLDQYLSSSKKNGYIIRHQKKYSDSISETIELTHKGINRSTLIRRSLNEMHLTPENHNINVMVPLGIVLDRIKDPIEEILFLSLYTSTRTFDLDMFLKMLKDLRSGSNMVRVLSDLQQQPDQEALPSAGAFFRACFFGDISPEEMLENDTCFGNVFNLLLVAEANHKQGRLDQADAIYNHLLSGKVNLTENQWVIAKLGLAMTLFKRGKNDESIEMTRSVIDSTKNRIMISYGKQVMAKILSSSGRFNEALELYNRAVRSFDQQGIPLLSCIAYNNRGVVYYRMKDYDHAIKDWEKSVKYARKAGSSYSEAAILTNIADIESSRGNINLAIEQLERSRIIFGHFNDLEGLSLYEFNLALVLLDARRFDEAFDHFKLSETIALPLPVKYERDERRNYFIERAGENGFENIDDSIFEGIIQND